MELTKLIFRVDTSEIRDAKTDLDSLSKAIRKLESTQRDVTQTIRSQELAMREQNKTTEMLNREKARTAALQDKLTKSSEQSNKASKRNIDLLQRERDATDFMADGYSRGQAARMAYAKSIGIVGEELKEFQKLLETQRTLMGDDPFDQSSSGLNKLKKQYTELKEAVRQYNAESDLTRSQTRELARDKLRLIEKLKRQGASLSDVKKALREHNKETKEAAERVNKLTQVEKERERLARDKANAARNVQAAEERLFATTKHLNNEISQNATLNERAALALGSYERNLKLAGITGEEAARKLQKFRQAQEEVSKHEAKRRGDFVARGVGVQMGDVGVSLASGQNPLIVAIQQGDQIRGMFQQAADAGIDMNTIMRQAMSGIVQSFKDVGTAVGSFFMGGIESAGRGVLELTGKFFHLNKIIELAEKHLKDSKLAGMFPDSLIERAGKFAGKLKANTGLMRTLGLGVAGAATAFVSLGVAILQAAKANDQLAVSLATSGAALGLAHKEVVAFANANNKYSTSANELKGFIAELSKQGFEAKNVLEEVTDAAQRFAHVTGESLEDVAVEFGEFYKSMGSDPVKALVKLGKASGYDNVETVKMVAKLQLAGKASEAAELAALAHAESLRLQADQAESNLTAMGKLYRTVKQEVSSLWDVMSDAANSEAVTTVFKTLTSAVATLANMVDRVLIGFGAFGKAWASLISDGLDFSITDEYSRFINDMEKSEKKLGKTLNKIWNPDVAKDPSEGQDTSANRAELLAFGQEWNKILKERAENTKKLAKDDRLASAINFKSNLDSLKESIKEEEAIYKLRLDMIKLYHDDAKVMTPEESYAARTAAVEEFAVAQDRLIEQQITLLEGQKKDAEGKKEVAEIQKQINKLLHQQNAAAIEASGELVKIQTDQFVDQVKIRLEAEKERIKEEKRLQTEHKNFVDGIYNDLGSNLQKFFLNPTEEGFKGMMKGILGSWKQMTAKMLADEGVKALRGLFGDGSKGSTGASGLIGSLGSLLGIGGSTGSSGGSIIDSVVSWGSSLFAGMFDDGGRIPSGRWGIAGERGPEIIQGPANVTSRVDTAKMLGGSNVSVQIINNAPGVVVREEQLSDGEIRLIVEDQVQRSIRRDVPSIVANQFDNPNSPVSRSAARNLDSNRRR